MRGNDSVAVQTVFGQGRGCRSNDAAPTIETSEPSVGHSLALALPAILPLTIVAVLIWLTFTQTPAVPVWDEWEMVNILREMNAGSLDLMDFWRFHSDTEQRIVASRVAGLVIIELTAWNRQAHMAFNLVLTAITATLLVRAVSWTVASRTLTIVLAAPIFALCFSVTRFANWFLPFTDKIPTVLAVAGCVWALTAPRCGVVQVGIALTAATIASLSSSGGLLVWIAFAPALLLVHRKAAFLWTAIAVAIVAAYLAGFQSGALNRAYAEQGTTLLPPLEAVGFILAYLGAPLGYPDVTLSQLFGALGLALLVVHGFVLTVWGRLTKAERRKLVVWLGAAAFALLSAGAIMIGRGVRFGIESAITSRYIGLSSFLWIAALALVATSGATSAAKFPGRNPLLGKSLAAFTIVALVATVVGFGRANVIAFNHASGYLAQLQANQGCVLAFERAPEACLGLYHWDVPRLRDQASFLKQRQYGIFSLRDKVAAGFGLSHLAEDGPGEYRCQQIGKMTRRDPLRVLPAEWGPDVVALACSNARAEAVMGVGEAMATEQSFEGPCAVKDWDVVGEQHSLSNYRYCLVAWYEGETPSGVSIVMIDSPFIIHAYPDGSLNVFREGQRVRS